MPRLSKNNVKGAYVLAAAILSTVFVACATGDAASPDSRTDEATAAETPTFHRDVAPILQKRCQSCHVAGDIAPFALMTYADAKPMAGPIAQLTKSKLMPPWGAHDTDDCKVTRPFRA